MTRILVVDDEKSIVFALRQYFSGQGHAVDAATTVEEALELLAAHSYTVAIIDIHLRGSADGADGLNVAAFIRQHAPNTVVIILTALETPETQLRAREVGVHSFLRKPMRLAHVADVAFNLMQGGSTAIVH